MHGDFNTTEESENSLLNSILEGSATFSDLKAVLDTEDFSTETNRIIFRAMESLTHRGEPIDFLTLCDELNKFQRPNEQAWASYITNLPHTALPLEKSMLNFHLSRVKGFSQTRWLWKLSHMLIKSIEAGDESEKERLRGEIANFKHENNEVDIINLSSHVPERLNWLLESAVPKGFPAMIYGEGGMGKSYLALLIAIQMTMGGQKFLGLRFADKALNVLYVDYELDKDEITRRAQKVSKGLGLEKVPVNLLYFSPAESLPRSITKLRNIIESKAIDFLVVDSLGASAVDGEHVPDVVNLFAEIRKMGVTTLLLDHQAKQQTGDRYSRKTPFGSVYKFNLCRSVFQLSCQSRDGNKITLRLHHTKSNFGRLIDDLVFDVSFEGDRVLFTESAIQSTEAREIELIKRAIEDLSKAGDKVNTKAIVKHLSGKLGRTRILELLRKEDGVHWDCRSGGRTEKLYSLRIPEFQTIYTRNSGILKNGVRGEDAEYYSPEEFLEEGI